MNQFKERALDYNEIIAEKELIQLCVKGMQDEYKLHIENHTIMNFVNLMEKVENIESSVSKIRKEKQANQTTTSSWCPFVKKQKVVAMIEQPHQNRRDFPILADIPLTKNQIISLVKA